MPRPVTPAAQYLRMSTNHQRYSLGNQASAIRNYALEHGFEIVRSYEDAGRSGLTTKHRDGLNTLISDVISGSQSFTHILVLDVSRWGRFQDPDEAAHYEFICREAGVRVVYCGEGFADDVGGTILKQLKRVMAGEYSVELSRKVQHGLRRSCLRGQVHGGPASFGFRRAAHEPDGTFDCILEPGRRSQPGQTVKLVWGPPEEVATLRLIFRLYVYQRLTPAKIAARLNREGRTRGGKSWEGIDVVRALTNEIAIGVMVFNKNSYHLGERLQPYPPSQWIRRQVCSPVISPRVFQMAQTRRRELSGKTRTDREMLDALRLLLAKVGRLSERDIDRAPNMATAFGYWLRFGSLAEAFRLIGYDVSTRPDARLTTQKRQEIISGLQRIHRKYGGINATLINSDLRLPSARSIVSRFGPLAGLYQEAGLTASTKGWQRKRGSVQR